MKEDNIFPYVQDFSKQLNLQGIRGVAVILVVLFHFYPNIFRHGYLGVDIFFVLSGYLIAMILHKNEIHTFRSLYEFYFKRVRRIVPFLALIVFLCVGYSKITHNSTFQAIEYRSAIYALFFVTNFRSLNDEDIYFLKLEKAADFFTHTWSLGIEMQTYLILPLIIIAVNWATGNRLKRQLAAYTTLAVLSMIYSLFIDHERGFNSPIARLYQFCMGVIVFRLQTSEDVHQYAGDLITGNNQNTDNRFANKKLIFILTIKFVATLLFLLTGSETILRIVITITTGLLLLLKISSIVLTNRLIVYIGDISYALYLVHWPIVCLLREHHQEFILNIDKVLAIAISFTIAALLHETYERWYLKQEKPGTFILITVLYLSSLLIISLPFAPYSTPTTLQLAPRSVIKQDVDIQLDNRIQPSINSAFSKEDSGNEDDDRDDTRIIPSMNSAFSKDDSADEDDVPPYSQDLPLLSNALLDWWDKEAKRNVAIEEAMKMNEKFEKEWSENLKMNECLMIDDEQTKNPFGLCQYPNGTGSLKFLVIGNSLAPNHAPLIAKHFARDYSSLHFYTQAECEALPSSLNRTRCGPPRLRLYREVIERIQPDILFIVQRWLEPSSGGDELTHSIIENIDRYGNNTKKVFVLQAIPLSRSDLYEKMNALIASGKPIDQSSMDPIEVDAKPLREAISKVAKSCANCVIFDVYQRHLNDKKEFVVMHPTTKILFFEKARHYTPYGLHWIEPVYMELVANFERLLKTKSPDNVFEWNYT